MNDAVTVSNIPGYGPMAALALTGISYFNKVQGEDNVKYWFINDANNAALFNAGQAFMQYKKGDVINEASQMKSPLSGKIYLALLNDNTVDPIRVTIKITSIQVVNKWGTRIIRVMKVSNQQIPYLKNQEKLNNKNLELYGVWCKTTFSKPYLTITSSTKINASPPAPWCQ